MNMQASTRFWTFNTLLAAFLDLFVAYFLLCGSTVALFAVKFLGLFGFVGIDGLDYRRLLVDCPNEKVSGARVLVTRKFPFDSIFDGVGSRHPVEDVNVDDDDDDDDDDDEESCSSWESDGGKLIGNNGIDESVSSSSNWVTCVDQQSIRGEEPEQCSFILSDVNSCNCEVDTSMMVKSIRRYDEYVNEDDKDKMIVYLTHDLEQAQAACAALNTELEKERNAAASAADEAMSMILRVQEEKASAKMELLHYQRMIKEKSAYDAEEMSILKEIVLRREREKHFLEKQVEAYRQMIRDQNDHVNGGSNEDFVPDSILYEDVDVSKQEEAEKTIAIVGEEKDLETGSSVYDVHVIDNEPKSGEKSNGNMKQTDQQECGVGLPSASSKSSLRRYSTSALDNKRTRLDTEVEWLRERLRIVQEGRVKLNFCVDNGEKESLRLHLLEDIACQLQEIRLMTEPRTARQASLPLPSSKVGLTKKRRCRSVSSGS
ncbi:uncharacterized protein LOC143578675 [Bidens hawaiensis]|uniref:uncharacterized protein LOC143578675 n=1 Tax=Bidens hawaiensis TaxID=980011 RepID=UPI00404A0DE4